jgi:ABC-type nitrate/sulfonate/bicarbonate transport system substrate-binding protein
VANGTLDAFFSCEVPAIHMLEGRADARIVAAPGVLGRIAVVTKGIPALAGLAGKTIGLSSGSTPAMDWETWGQKLGANVVDLPTDGLFDALMAGKVDAVASWDPWVEKWTEQAPLSVVAEREFRSVLAVSTLWSIRADADQTTPRARRLVELVEEALRIAASDRPKWDAIVAEKTGWPVAVVKAVADRNAILAGEAGTIDVQQVDRDDLDRAGRFATQGRLGANELVGLELLSGQLPPPRPGAGPPGKGGPGGPKGPPPSGGPKGPPPPGGRLTPGGKPGGAPAPR